MSVIFAAEVPVVTEVGEAEHVASDGAPLQAKVTLASIPATPPTTKAYVAACPGVTLDEEEEPDDTVSVKSCPVPLSDIFCGAPGALSAMVMLPERVPVAVGVKVASIVQSAFAATVPPL